MSAGGDGASTSGANANPFDPDSVDAATVNPAVEGIADRIIKFRSEFQEWNEHRNKYLLFFKQLVVEIQNLDESVEEVRCFPHDSEGSGDSIKVDNVYEHSDCFSKLILELVVDEQCALVCSQHVDLFMHIYTSSIPRFIDLCHVRSESSVSSSPNVLSTEITTLFSNYSNSFVGNTRKSSSANFRSFIPVRANAASQRIRTIAESFMKH